MTSDLAESEVAAMAAQGLKPTVRDIVRMNALALKIQYGPHAAEQYALPRVAFLGNLVLRQPTIAHEIWLDRVMSIVEMDDESYFACRLYVASRAASALCDPLDRAQVKEEVERNLAAFGAHTIEAVALALRYVWHGGGEMDAEYAPVREADETQPTLRPEDSVALGIMHNGAALRLGLSLAEMSGMTRAHLLAVTHGAVGTDANARKNAASRARVDFFRAVDEIRARLEAEKAKAEQAAKEKEAADGDARE